jgi:peptidoglycan LD-endopeptidase LytH
VRAGRFVAPVLAVVVVLPLLGIAGAQAQSLGEIQDRLRDARSERAEIEDRLARAAEELDELEVVLAELEAEQQQLDAERRSLEASLTELGAVIELRVRESFKYGSSLDPMAVFLASDDPGAALSRAQTVQRLVAGEQLRTEEVAASRVRLAAVIDRLEEHADEVAAAESRQREVIGQLTADLERAQELEQRLTRQEREERARIERERRERERRERERAAARRAASAAAATSSGSGGTTCPLDRPRHYTDTWGAPRSGGRGHRGTDILGPYGIPVRAVTSGVWVVQRPGRSAGNWGILRGDDGNHYWYMHLQSHTVASGTRVSAGQQVATNGDTGNARGTPHVHFEKHPGGGSAVNPYPLVRRVCG